MRTSGKHILKYNIMNSVEKSPSAGESFQVHIVTLIEPWFIKKETSSQNNSLTGDITPIMGNSFVEYYY